MAKVKVAPEKVINGTWGEVWVGDDWLGNATGVEAKVTIEKEEVKQIGTLAKGYKTTGLDCKGTVKLNKVNSMWIKLLSDQIKKGKCTPVNIITKLKDPDSDGTERVKLINCTFDELVLADWESGKLIEESVPFTFTNWKVLDAID